VREQAADLRRFMVASLDGLGTRIVNELRQVAAPPPVEAPPAQAPLPRAPVWPWIAGLAGALAIAVLSGVLWVTTREDLANSRAELATLSMTNTELQRSNREMGSTIKDLTSAFTASAATASASRPARGAGRIEPVPYGELPFDRGRLEALREFLGRLEGQNYRGVVKITSAAGLFCLTGNAAEGYAPAPPSLPASKCDMVGNPFDESLTPQTRQSPAFANLIAGLRQRSSGAISVVLDNPGSSRPAVPYPQRNESLTAGEWNRAAALNNRVEYTAEAGGGT
ncbi:MAG: hypothetical protein M3O06_12235, partial [Pseudomonadota bacterium]|nr:hypothetical protein [Pseudomonadota bacterium]